MKHNWEYKRLGDICEILDSQRKPITKSDRISGPYPYYGASGIQDYVSDYIFDGDLLLVGEDGAKWGANEKSAFSISGKSWVNNHAHVLDFKKSPVSQRLIEYFLCGCDLNKSITGAVVPKLTQKNLVSIPVPVPPMETQEQIVAELDQINDLIAKNSKLLSQLDALAQSLFYDTFGDPIANPKGWNTKFFSDVIKLRSGDGLSAKNIVAGIYPVFGGNGIVGYHNEPNLKGENIIIGRVGALCGNVRLVKGDIFVTDNAFVTEYKENFNLIFLEKLLAVLNLRQYAYAAAQPVISNASLKKIIIPLPPLELQEEFAAKVEAIEAQKAKVEAEIAELQTLLDARMDYWFN